jgi:penicillin-binding protein 1A
MKKCYQDPDLLISKDEFERPENFSIKVDCYSAPKQVVIDSTITEEQNPDEFGL